jgi:hypothetical protein
MGRYTLLLVIENCILRDAIAMTNTLSSEFTRRFPDSTEIIDTEIYAVGVARPIQERMHLPRPLEDSSPAATAQGTLHGIWKGNKWVYPHRCPSAPPESNGATAWQWAHYNAIASADPEAFLFVFDIYVQEKEMLDAA